MKALVLAMGLVFSASVAAETNAPADFIAGDMQLRDAIYSYNQKINSYWYTDLVGYNCDVLQLVLDVESGYTDIWMKQGSGAWSLYPDRIQSYHAMFAYALYQNVTWKTFELVDRYEPYPSYQIGSGTMFGYCYSTKPDAYVYIWDEYTNTCKYSDGYIWYGCY